MSAKLSERINGLPNWARDYIHDLETRCDITGDIRMIHIQKETIAYLEQQLAAKDAEIVRLRSAMVECGISLEIIADELNVGNMLEISTEVAQQIHRVVGMVCAALAETSAAPLTALALPEDDVPDAAPEVK